eukprot:SAG11_NODE_7384_length_1152_cov_1.270655_3_plen_188_part_01
MFQTNNLEKWRAAVGDDSSWPRVLFFTRSELLSGIKSYPDLFVPLETENEAKDEVDEAIHFYTEYRIAPFTDYGVPGSKVEEYISAHVAVQTRALLMAETKFGLTANRSQDANARQVDALQSIAQLLSSGSKRLQNNQCVTEADVNILRDSLQSIIGSQWGKNSIDQKFVQKFIKDKLPSTFWAVKDY